jgi:hypothetical protein
MSKGQQFSEFEAYLKDRQWRTRRSQSEIEKVGTKAALVRCRELARQIQSDLLKKSPDDFVDLLALADFQVSIERVPRCWHTLSRTVALARIDSSGRHPMRLLRLTFF